MEERGSWISNNGRVAPPITATILTRLLLLSGGRGGFIRHARLMIDAWSPYEYYRLLMINELTSRGRLEMQAHRLRALPLASRTRGRPGSHHAPRRIVRKSALNPRIRLLFPFPLPRSARFLSYLSFFLFSIWLKCALLPCERLIWMNLLVQIAYEWSSLRLGRGSAITGKFNNVEMLRIKLFP